MLKVNICLFYGITVFKKYRAKYMIHWMSIMNLFSLMGVMLYVRFKMRNAMGELLSVFSR